MSGLQPWQVLLVGVLSLVGVILTVKGARYTADRASQGVSRSTEAIQQQSALDAWKDMATELTEPIRAELREARKESAALRVELNEEREERQSKERRDEEERTAAKELVTQQMSALQEQVDKLRDEVKVWKRVAQTIARWATTLRDEVLRLGGTVPATPDELLTLQAIQEHEQP